MQVMNDTASECVIFRGRRRPSDHWYHDHSGREVAQETVLLLVSAGVVVRESGEHAHSVPCGDSIGMFCSPFHPQGDSVTRIELAALSHPGAMPSPVFGRDRPTPTSRKRCLSAQRTTCAWEVKGLACGRKRRGEWQGFRIRKEPPAAAG